MAHTLLAVLSLVAVLWGNALCTTVTLNITAITTCAQSFTCWFQDPANWNNGTAPETNYTVIIASPHAFLMYNETIVLKSLLIQNTTFLLLGNASITAANVTLESSSIIIEEQATMVSEQNTYLLEVSSLVLRNNGGYAQAGTLFSLGTQSMLYATDDASIGLHGSSSQLHGNLLIESNHSIFIATGPLYFHTQNFFFPNTPTIYTAYFNQSTVEFKQGWKQANYANLQASNVTIHATTLNIFNSFSVDAHSTLYLRGIPDCTFNSLNITGTLYISSSNVEVSQSQTFSSPLVLAGMSDFSVDVLVLKTISFALGEDGERPYINILANILHVMGSFTFPSCDFYISQFAYFSGSQSLTGGINIFGTMYVDGILNVNGKVNVGVDLITPRAAAPPKFKAANEASLSINGASLDAISLNIGNGATFEVVNSTFTGALGLLENSTLTHHNSSFYGVIYSDGHISVHHELSLQGNFSQGSQGTLSIINLDLANRSSGYLSITGSVVLDGTIAYSIASQPLDDRRMQLVVVEATNGVTGKFISEPVNIGVLENKPALTYTQNDVYLVFGKTSRDQPLRWWVWLAVVLGVALVIGLLGLLYVNRHRRKGFEPVPL